ncbi:MAG: DegV family protein [Leptolinea sp.]|jgi:DegV family protein with EDD domain|nr:DegV family protein [Leptolinea sp.]
MTVRIVTDSTCDLPAETITRYGIYVIPLYINIDNQGYLDGVDISRAEFYKRLPLAATHPSTAVPSIERFIATYNTLADEGASEVLSIHISTALSGVIDVARVAAREVKSTQVTVFDSRQLSLGTGFLVEMAAKMASASSTIVEILKALNDQVLRTHVFAALDTVEFLKRSGRMNKYVAGLATLIQIKPILTMYNGKPGSERVFTRDRALKRVVEMLASAGKLECVAMVHTHTSEEILARLRTMAAHLLPPNPILAVDITPVIGAHIGPGAAGFTVIQASTR